MKNSVSSPTRVLNLLLALSASSLPSVYGFNINSNTNLAAYWGQDDWGGSHLSDPSSYQQSLGFYCGSDSVVNAFPVAFVDVFFDSDGLPSLNLANICSPGSSNFAGTDLPDCSFLASDIEACQAAGKIVTISLGGAGASDGFSSNSQAQSFANTIWDLFLGGSSSTRPFGNAILDGVDLDIENGANTGYAAFVSQIRSLSAGASKQYYVTGAPQCPFPDAYLGAALDSADFDAVYVQFYNNNCELTAFNTGSWNFGTWDNWAKTQSVNKNVKVYIGAPAASTAAGSGYVSASTLATIIQTTKSQYSSFGGVMLWDISDAYANGRYDVAVKNALTGAAAVKTNETEAAIVAAIPSNPNNNRTTSETPSGKNSRLFRL